MIKSAKEFIELRRSQIADEYLRASNEEAPEEIWQEVISQFPEATIWVIQNKTVPLSILEQLATSASQEIRHAVAMKNKLSPFLYDALSKDNDENVRERIVYNKNTPVEILTKLAKDPVRRISDKALQRLKSPP